MSSIPNAVPTKSHHRKTTAAAPAQPSDAHPTPTQAPASRSQPQPGPTSRVPYSLDQASSHPTQHHHHRPRHPSLKDFSNLIAPTAAASENDPIASVENKAGSTSGASVTTPPKAEVQKRSADSQKQKKPEASSSGDMAQKPAAQARPSITSTSVEKILSSETADRTSTTTSVKSASSPVRAAPSTQPVKEKNGGANAPTNPPAAHHLNGHTNGKQEQSSNGTGNSKPTKLHQTMVSDADGNEFITVVGSPLCGAPVPLPPILPQQASLMMPLINGASSPPQPLMPNPTPNLPWVPLTTTTNISSPTSNPRRLFVAGPSIGQASDVEIVNLFSQFGKVERINRIYGRNMEARQMVYVEYTDSVNATAAQEYHIRCPLMLNGERVHKVEVAKPKPRNFLRIPGLNTDSPLMHGFYSAFQAALFEPQSPPTGGSLNAAPTTFLAPPAFPSFDFGALLPPPPLPMPLPSFAQTPPSPTAAPLYPTSSTGLNSSHLSAQLTPGGSFNSLSSVNSTPNSAYLQQPPQQQQPYVNSPYSYCGCLSDSYTDLTRTNAPTTTSSYPTYAPSSSQAPNASSMAAYPTLPFMAMPPLPIPPPPPMFPFLPFPPLSPSSAALNTNPITTSATSPPRATSQQQQQYKPPTVADEQNPSSFLYGGSAASGQVDMNGWLAASCLSNPGNLWDPSASTQQQQQLSTASGVDATGMIGMQGPYGYNYSNGICQDCLMCQFCTTHSYNTAL